VEFEPLKRNPYLAVFPYAKRVRAPRVMPSHRRFVSQQAQSSRRPLTLPSRWRIVWQDEDGRFSRFRRGVRMRGVVLAPYAKGVRLTRKEKTLVERKRVSGRRYRVKSWLLKSFKLLIQLTRLAKRYPGHIPDYTKKRGILYERFVERRERAIQLGRIPPHVMDNWLTALNELDEVLGVVVGSETVWRTVNEFMYDFISRPPWSLSPGSWNEEVRIARMKFQGSFPLNFIRVIGNDPLAHPQGSANLLILDEKFAEADLDRFTSGSFIFFVIGQMTKAQDHLVDQHGRFTKSPSAHMADSMVALPSMKRRGLGRWPTAGELRKAVEKQKAEEKRVVEVTSKEGPTLAFLSQSKPGRYVLLACPLVIRREFVQGDPAASKDKTLRDAHDFLFRMPEPRKPFKSNKRYRAAGRGAYPVFVFGKQPVWMEVFQRFYWAKGLYIIPRVFIGYTPREMSKGAGAM